MSQGVRLSPERNVEMLHPNWCCGPLFDAPLYVEAASMRNNRVKGCDVRSVESSPPAPDRVMPSLSHERNCEVSHTRERWSQHNASYDPDPAYSKLNKVYEHVDSEVCHP